MNDVKKSSKEIINEWLTKELSRDEVIAFIENRAKDSECQANNYSYPNLKDMHLGMAKVFRRVIFFLKQEASNDTSLRCKQCNEEFIPKSAKSRFCSGKCRTAYHRANKGKAGPDHTPSAAPLPLKGGDSND